MNDSVDNCTNQMSAQNVPPKAHHHKSAFILFVALFVALQWVYDSHLAQSLAPFFTETLGSHPGVWIINQFTPDLHAKAVGSRIISATGGINIRQGCDGVEIYFLLIAAFAVAPLASMTWPVRLLGLGVGCIWVAALNLMRSVALFYLVQYAPHQFDFAHTVLAPLLLAGLCLLYVYGVTRWASTARVIAPRLRSQ